MSDKHSSAKEAALQKLMDLLDSQDAEDLKGLKAKPVSMSVTEIKPKGPLDDMEPSDDEDEEGPSLLDHSDDEFSEEDKAKVAALYHKMFK
jgi:hypothetical protein